MNWLNDFSDWLEDRVHSPATLSAYRQDARQFSAWFEAQNGEPFAPEKMNSFDAHSFRKFTLEVERLSASTWNRRRASLAMLCSWIEEDQGVKLFRMKAIPRADEQKKAPRWLIEGDKRRVLRELEIGIRAADTEARRFRAQRDQAMAAMMVFAGLRVSEICNLQVRDLVLRERSGWARIVAGKGDKYDSVPLSSTVREILAGFLQSRAQNRFYESEFLFFGETGKQLTTRAVQKRLQQLEDRLGIDGLEPHALRHTCAKSMLDAGADMGRIKGVMRHKRIDTTMQYTLPSEEELLQAVEMGELGKGARR